MSGPWFWFSFLFPPVRGADRAAPGSDVINLPHPRPLVKAQGLRGLFRGAGPALEFSRKKFLYNGNCVTRGAGPALEFSRKKFLRDGNCVTRGGTFIGIGNVLSLSKTSPKRNLLPFSLFTLHFSLNIRRGRLSFPFEKSGLRDYACGDPPP